MKKQLLLLIVLLMPLLVNAATKINGIYYNLNSTNKVAEVTYDPSGTALYSGSIVIPKTVAYGGVTYSVTSIDDYAFWGCSSMTSIDIPNSVTSIGNEAFCACSGLASVDIPNSVTSIGEGAFWGCSGFTSVIIPHSVTGIGGNAFQDCSGLTSVTIGSSVTYIGEGAFSGCTGLKAVHITDLAAWCKINFHYDFVEFDYSDNPLFYAHHLYLNDEEVKELVIPDGITSIKSVAFHGCSGLTSVTIPNSVTSIGDNAFNGCSGIEEVTFHCQTIGSWFSNMGSIKEVIIGNEVKYIGAGAFSGCSGLTSITIPNSVTSIGDNAFNGCSGLKSVNISDIATWCNISFRYPESNPLCYAHHLFLNGEEVKDLNIPNTVTSIGDRAFSGCSDLTSVTIPNNVTSIGNNAFEGCSVLSSVSIGKGIKSIGSMAFANCPEIKEVYCYAKDVPTISNDTFKDSYYIKWATLYVPESSVDSYKASAWSQFGNIVGITGGNEGERCEKPTITLFANGKIKVQSATEGATCVTNISASTANPLTDGEISLSTPLIVYTVTAYATAEGYDDSEVATATFRFEGNKGDVDGDGKIDISDLTQLVNIILGQ